MSNSFDSKSLILCLFLSLMNKRGYEFSFAWLFALIIGASIIIFAIYSATRIVETKRFESETLQAKQLGILLNPTETNLESARLTTINARNTRILNDCDSAASRGIFGSQDISAQIKSGIGKEWTEEPGAQSSFHNKYMFSDDIVEAEKEFYVFSKPLKFPFKIADLLILTSDNEKYCFVMGNRADEEEIKKELRDDLKIKNVYFVDSENDCIDDDKKVSFMRRRCDDCVSVDLSNEKVEKEEKTLHYVKSSDSDDKYALLYAAIFSNSTIYECQVKRLFAGRAAQLARLYNEKAKFFFVNYQCGGSVVQDAFLDYENAARGIYNSGELNSMESISQDLKIKNENLRCKIF